MDPKQKKTSSIIITGSDLNHRTFDVDESWNSLQSTILGGHWTTDYSIDDDAKEKDLTTVKEEEDQDTSALFKDDFSLSEDLLNKNIDAIEDDEVFFDGPSYSPQYSPKKSRKSPSFTVVDTNYGKLLTISSSSGVYSSEERTGSMLAQMVIDFNNIKNQAAQSTPNMDTSHEFNGDLSSKRKISFSSEDDPENEKVDKAIGNKENNSSRTWKPVKRVAKMKKFFENKISQEVGNNKAKKTSANVTKPAQVKFATLFSQRNVTNNSNVKTSNRLSGFVPTPANRKKSATFKTMCAPKVKITPAKQHNASSKVHSSGYLSPSSCFSNYQLSCELPEENNNSTSSKSSRSHLENELRQLCESNDTNFMQKNDDRFKDAIKRGAIVTRPGFLVSRKASFSESQIRKRRRSVGMVPTKSPIKPVKELRKVFSPPKS